MRKVYIFFTLLVLFFTTSCDPRNMPNTAMTEFGEMRANASPDFRQGWEDGCETGSASTANNFHKLIIYDSVKVDGYKITQSNEYKTAWNFAWWYCYRYMYVKHKSTIWGSFFGGYK